MKKNKLYKYLLIGLVALAGCETAFMSDLSTKKVVLLSPVNNHVTTDTMQTFYWDKLNDAEQYRLQIVGPKFDSILRLVIDTTMVLNTFTIDMEKGTYQWRVTARNSGSVSNTGDTWNLQIQ